MAHDPFAIRRPQQELMDALGADPEMIRTSLRFIRRVNAAFGYTRATVKHLERFSRGWKRGERIDLLDIGTGSADIPRAVLRWADRRGLDVRIVGVDLHAQTADEARRSSVDPRLTIMRADALALPFEPGSFDYVLTAMFLHHLDDNSATKVLETMGRLARRGVIAADLLRHRRAYRWIKFFTLFSNPMVKHDARVSVMQAFDASEIRSMARRAGLDFATFHHHFGHRFILAGEKPSRGTLKLNDVHPHV